MIKVSRTLEGGESQCKKDRGGPPGDPLLCETEIVRFWYILGPSVAVLFYRSFLLLLLYCGCFILLVCFIFVLLVLKE